MRMFKACVIGVFIGLSQWGYAEAPPVQVLDRIAQNIVAVLKTHQSELKSNSKVINQAVEEYLLPHVDTVGMSRSVLGREAWHRASMQEKTAFTKAFTQLVIRTYATPLAKYQGETIRFHPIRGGVQGRFVRVESEIVRPVGPPIPLDYSLVSLKGEWKIYDLSVEGVSLLQSYRSQFEDALRKNSVGELTDKLNNQAHAKAKS
ncbi:MAG: ABC transporter substrate-binding protein [Gammaproteobacteria bacterium]|nr:ABC transporter substrate-binding protein [Gammaproteobacteria bacterium]